MLAAVDSVAACALTTYLVHGIAQRGAASEAARDALARSLPLVATSCLVAFLVIGGLVLLVVPGVWAALACFLAIPVMAIERCYGFAALRRSRNLMRGRKLALLLPLLLWLALDVGADLAIEKRVGADAMLGDLLYSVPSALLGAYLNVFALLFYLDARSGTPDEITSPREGPARPGHGSRRAIARSRGAARRQGSLLIRA
jgi:hypothetical protein